MTIYDSPKNGRSFRNFEATKRSIFGQKSNDNRRKRQSMQITHNSIGSKKVQNFATRTNSNETGSYTLTSPKILNLPGIPTFNINSDSESTFDGTVKKEDSLRSSKDLNTQRMFSKSINYEKQQGAFLNPKKYSETPRDSGETFEYDLSTETTSKHRSTSKQMLSEESEGKKVEKGEKKQNKTSNRFLILPDNSMKEDSQKSKEDEPTGPLLPIRPSSIKKMKNRQRRSSKFRTEESGADIKINVFQENSESSSVYSRNQGAPSVITFKRASKMEVSSTNSVDNNSHDSRGKVYKKSRFINSNRFNQRMGTKKASSTKNSKQKRALDHLKKQIKKIENNFIKMKTFDHIDVQIYNSIIFQIKRVDSPEFEKVLKVKLTRTCRR